MKKSFKNKHLNSVLQRVSSALNAGHFEEADRLLGKYEADLVDLQIFHNMKGAACAGLREHDHAVQHFLKSIKINPLDPMPFTGIGNSLAKNLQFEEAGKYYKLALVIDENYLDALVGVGVVAFQQSDYDACEHFFKRALERKPNHSVVLTNLANTYSAQGRHQEAMPLWDRALKLNPLNAQARMNRGLAGLGMGNFERAWDDYEDRFHEDNFIPERFKDLPKWPGPSRETQPVLIWVEQGIGDEIMFASMYEELSGFQEKFAAECNPRLIDTFRESFPHIFFFPTRSLAEHTAFRYQISIASLGRLLRRNHQSFYDHRPAGGYLKQAEDELTLETSSALHTLPRPWIGVSWESYALTKNFRGRKSISSTEFSIFTQDFKGSFINLQYSNPHPHETQTPSSIPENVHSLPNLDLTNDLRGLTSLLSRMDHIVTIGNSVAHLCGAFGIPATVLLPSVADWRWGFSGEKSVWYESLELRRNPDQNSWTELLADIKLKIQSYC